MFPKILSIHSIVRTHTLTTHMQTKTTHKRVFVFGFVETWKLNCIREEKSNFQIDQKDKFCKCKGNLPTLYGRIKERFTQTAVCSSKNWSTRFAFHRLEKKIRKWKIVTFTCRNLQPLYLFPITPLQQYITFTQKKECKRKSWTCWTFTVKMGCYFLRSII